MFAGKNTGASAFGGLALEALYLENDTRQEMSGDRVLGGAPAKNGFSVI